MIIPTIATLLLNPVTSPPPAFTPNPADLRAAYKRADDLRTLFSDKATGLRLLPHWYDNSHYFWYTKPLQSGNYQFNSVDSNTGEEKPAFDHQKLARALGETGQPTDSRKLQITNLEIEPTDIKFVFNAKNYTADLTTYKLTEGATVPHEPRPPRSAPWTQDLHPPETDPITSPDGAWAARIAGKGIRVKPKDGEEFQLGTLPEGPAYPYHLDWRPDSKKLLIYRVTPGDRKPVYLIQSTPPGGGRAVLHSRVYDLPGDKTDTIDLWMGDPAAKSISQVQMDPIDYGDTPYPRWAKDNHHFTYEKMDRGFQRWRVISVDTDAATSNALVEDTSKTFVDSTTTWTHYCDSGEILWRSERDGWGHLYLSDPAGKIENQITKGNWVVRGVERVDEKKGQIVFEASGVHDGEDPYFIHYFRINFDGTGLKELTPAAGNHTVQFSPDGESLVDTYSSATNPPVHELRKASDGTLVKIIEKADIEPLKAAGWKAPEVFVAKARDHKTDIWGLVFRPTNMDPRRSYPILEDIYAGPQDSFTPKDFAPYRYDQAVAELGFVVVKVDGMGTRNRSKAFHDVCWKNLADSGFPDRILWIKALAAKNPNLDINRVGIFGTSAGGQNSTAAMLFHPEFYKAAVSSCGCHDNRMDKLWWNEQWMGYPLGPEYAEQSNITNAAKLKGSLLLMVGEMDSNVPPETTIRLCDALMKAGKEFDFLVIPGSDHTDGGPYGERKRRDFFVKHLLGVTPPDWNEEENPPGRLRRP